MTIRDHRTPIVASGTPARFREIVFGQMSTLIVCVVALLASGLTFFSGFGLGTLLLPAFALFYPIEQAVALTAVVHFLNGLFKLWLVGRHANLRVVLLFGLPALGASFLGAWVLLWLSEIKPLVSYTLLGREVLVAPQDLSLAFCCFCLPLPN